MPISRDRPRPGLSLLSPRLHTKALGTRLEVTFLSLIGQDKYPSSRTIRRMNEGNDYSKGTAIQVLYVCG
jgi:hypothetical protein